MRTKAANDIATDGGRQHDVVGGAHLLVDQQVGIKWTTLIRFEETLQDQAIWDLAAKAGCCTLYYGMESANERVLNLMDKHAKKSVIQRNLEMAAK